MEPIIIPVGNRKPIQIYSGLTKHGILVYVNCIFKFLFLYVRTDSEMKNRGISVRGVGFKTLRANAHFVG